MDGRMDGGIDGQMDGGMYGCSSVGSAYTIQWKVNIIFICSKHGWKATIALFQVTTS